MAMGLPVPMLLFGALLLLLQLHLAGSTRAHSPGGVVNVFDRAEMDYTALHKYSAVLAAIEPFRLQLQAEIQRSLNPVAFAFHRVVRTPLEDPSSSLRRGNAQVDHAYRRYEARINDVVRAYHINVHAFNDLSRKLHRTPPLKRKVLRQARHYREAADLEALNGPTVVVLPPARRRAPAAPFDTGGSSSGASELTRFCRALRLIEDERLRARDTLLAELGVRSLPPNMCDPTVRPLMCRQVQMACQAFPAAAGRVAEQHGFSADRFDLLFERTRRNPWFRFRVQNELGNIERAGQ